MIHYKDTKMKSLYTLYVTIGSSIAGIFTYLRVRLDSLLDSGLSMTWENIRAYSWALFVAGSTAIVAAMCKKLGDDLYERWKNRKRKK